MPMNAIGISLSGIRASSARLTASAANIANASSPVAPAQPGTPTANLPAVYRPVRAELRDVPEGGVASRLVTASPAAPLIPDPSGRYADIGAMTAARGIDVTGELVEQLAAKIAFGANLAVLRTASDMQGRLVDRWA